MEKVLFAFVIIFYGYIPISVDTYWGQKIYRVFNQLEKNRSGNVNELLTITSFINADDGLSRILNGSPANDDQFPYMISLQRLRDINHDFRGHRCGGVLVTLQHALTTIRYCTVDYNDSGQMVLINKDEYRVFGGGAAELTNDTSSDRVRRIANIVIHPEYNANVDLYINEIAVIVLGTPFLSNTVTTLAIRDIGTANMETCIIVGWGMGTLLTSGSMWAHNETMCQVYMGIQISPNLICGWYPGFSFYLGHAGCPGDEGGPLVCQDDLVGLISDIRGCATNPPRPHYYVRVSSYTTWIDSIIALPIPELGPEPSTVPPPTTTTTPAPGAAFMFKPGMVLLAAIAVTQIITTNVLN